ncbi:IS3 family transposase [Yanshouia hominis]|uniref:Transposase n=1 Tax=Yanshouia hominis TaxID=2763673 RepID=A0ABR7NIM2_9FIRM|nr:IS3 family transposase [Yanshouia hominis]MBC8576258.1 transposase [Yanshouia hominis]
MSGKKGKVHYSGEMKEQVRKEIGAGKSQREVSRKYGISRYAIHSWCGLRPETKLRQIAPLPKGRPRKIRTLEARRLPEGKQTVEDGKSITAGFSLAHRKDVKPKFKYQVICRHQAEYPVSAMCRFFGVSGSGYHDYIKRLGQAHKDAALAEKLRVQQAHCFQTYGYRRMHLWLESQGIHHNPKTVLRIMKKYGILSEIRRKRKWRNMGQRMRKYENLLNRQF